LLELLPFRPRRAGRGREIPHDYYGFLGEWADRIADSAPTTVEVLTGLVKGFEELGLDELILDPTIAELDQVDHLADALLLGGAGPALPGRVRVWSVPALLPAGA
jgi:hypothetical protein